MFFSCLILFSIFSSFFVSASLGIGPAKIELEFAPNARHEFRFVVSSDNPENNIDIYFDGELAQYATADKQFLIGGGEVIIILTLPAYLERPGNNNLFVRAKESAPTGEFLGAQIDIGAVVKVFVPYPGIYPILAMDIPDGNVGEKISVRLKVENKGSEALAINRVFVDIISKGEIVHKINFASVGIPPSGEKEFSDFFDTSDFRPGDYVAIATLDAGETWTINDTFRVGSLFFNVTNFTQSVSAKGIQKVFIDVESLWNNPLSGIYADVFIGDGLTTNVSFRTASVDFLGWEKKTLEGYLDTSGLKGDYPIEIVLHYSDKTNTVKGTIVIVPSNIYLIILAVLGVVVLIIVVVFLYLRHRRNSNKPRGSKK
mgnify:FL=1